MPFPLVERGPPIVFGRDGRYHGGMTKPGPSLDRFVPHSAAASAHPEITLRNAALFPGALAALDSRTGGMREPDPIEAFAKHDALAARFGERVRHYRANKLRCFHRLYGEILAQLGPEDVRAILEIGIGSVDPGQISNNGSDHVPGASLRAFRDLCPHAIVHGADIDRGVLFEEERIRTAWVDQLDRPSFEAMHAAFGRPAFDLIVDDGLHALSANLHTLLFGLDALRPGGFVVIEDIWGTASEWPVIERLVRNGPYRTWLIRCPVGVHAFVVQHVPDGVGPSAR